MGENREAKPGLVADGRIIFYPGRIIISNSATKVFYIPFSLWTYWLHFDASNKASERNIRASSATSLNGTRPSSFPSATKGNLSPAAVSGRRRRLFPPKRNRNFGFFLLWREEKKEHLPGKNREEESKKRWNI